MTARRTVLLTVTIIAIGACVNLDTENGPAVTVWETQLVPTLDFPGLSGQAAAVSRPDGTAVGIAVNGALEGAEHAWGLREGTCSAPGLQVGPDSDYPELLVDITGSAETETHLGPRLAYDGSYHVEVRVSAADPTRVACGDLVQP